VNNSKTKILLLISGFLQSIGIYFFIIKQALLSYRPPLPPSDFTSVALSYYSPEIEIPLYCFGVMFISILGLTLFIFLKHLFKNINSHILEIIAATEIRVSFLSMVILYYVLSFTSIPLFTVFFVLVFINFIKTTFYVFGIGKIDTYIARLNTLFDLLVSGCAIIFSCFILVKIYFTDYFSSTEFIELLRNAKLYAFIDKISWQQFTLVSLFVLFILWSFLNSSKIKFIRKFTANPAFSLIFDCFFILFTVFLISAIVPFTPFYGQKVFWFDFAAVMGTVNDILGGKTILVDSYSQYGLMMPYLLSVVFRFIRLNYANYFLANYLATILGYTTLYLALRIWFKNRFIPVFFLILALLFQYFALPSNILFFGMATCLRFGFWIAVFFYLVTKEKLVKNHTIRIILELLLICFGTFWTFDTGTYLLFSYIAYLMISGLMQKGHLKSRLSAIFKSISLVTISVLFTFILINLFSYLRSGSFPLWSEFYFHARIFSGGMDSNKLPLFGTYLLFLSFYSGLIIYIIYSLLEKKNKNYLPIIGFLTSYALLQFVYYIGESKKGGIQLIILPTLVLFCWIIYRFPKFIHKDIFTFFKKSEIIAAGTFCASAILLFLLAFTISFVNTVSAVKNVQNPAFFTQSFFENSFPPYREFNQSINWMNSALSDTPAYKRKIALITDADFIFLVNTKSTNIIDSGNIYYFMLKSQHNKLCGQLIARNPDTLFMAHTINAHIDILAKCAMQKYHFVENIGYLDRWEINKN
jgi:hypothetical protein